MSIVSQISSTSKVVVKGFILLSFLLFLIFFSVDTTEVVTQKLPVFYTQLLNQAEVLRGQLTRFGWVFQVNMFDYLFRGLSACCSWFVQLSGDSIGYTASLISLNVIFFIVAAIPAFIFFSILLYTIAALGCTAYGGSNLLGMLSNKRLFFSGLFFSKDYFNSNSNPNILIPNLVSLNKVNTWEVWNSKLYLILQEHGVWNRTIQELLRIILVKADMPAFLVDEKQKEFFSKRVEPMTLAEVVEATLLCTFDLLNNFRGSASEYAKSKLPAHDLMPGSDLKGQEKKIDLGYYQHLLQNTLERTLTPELKEQLAVHGGERLLVVVILSMAAGQIMVRERTGNRWLSRSLFPELTARAVLHSISSFGEDFSPKEREDIRRGIIYASRYTPMGPIHTPLDMSLLSFAIRQWSEIFYANPLKLPTLADEVELNGLQYVIHTKWSALFYEKIKLLDREMLKDGFVLSSNVLIIKVQSLIKLFRLAVDPKVIKRTEELISVIHRQNVIVDRSSNKSINKNEDDDADKNYSHHRIEPPLSFTEIRHLASEHTLSIEDLKDWSVLKTILGTYGWLSRRVGDVPVHVQIIAFFALQIKEQGDNKSDKTFIEKSGMVALREDRLNERFGEAWKSRFKFADESYMAESKAKLKETSGERQPC